MSACIPLPGWQQITPIHPGGYLLPVQKKEEDITHHGCGVAGAPSGLRSLFLLPGPENVYAWPSLYTSD